MLSRLHRRPFALSFPQGVSTQLTTAAATKTVTGAMGAATKSMQTIGTSMNMVETNKNLQEFAKENFKMATMQVRRRARVALALLHPGMLAWG